MEKNRKRPDSDLAENFPEKRLKTPARSQELESVEEEVMAWLRMEQAESSEELSKLLETTETAGPVLVKMRFIDDPYSAARIFQSSSSYITINGNEELCGSSFSDWDSSVMASVDVGGINFKGGVFGLANGWFKENEIAAVEGGERHLEVQEEARGWVEESGDGCLIEKINGGDGCDEYDDMLAKFLGEDLLETQ